MKTLLVAGALCCLSVPAFSAECTTQTFSEVAEVIENGDGKIIAIVDVAGIEFDQVIVAEHNQLVVVGRFKDGCAVGGPALLGPALTPA